MLWNKLYDYADHLTFLAAVPSVNLNSDIRKVG